MHSDFAQIPNKNNASISKRRIYLFTLCLTVLLRPTFLTFNSRKEYIFSKIKAVRLPQVAQQWRVCLQCSETQGHEAHLSMEDLGLENLMVVRKELDTAEWLNNKSLACYIIKLINRSSLVPVAISPKQILSWKN